ncbi:uncharacterized protein BDZ83DRAFT_649682 [Colletotrichum acutatum]|uniref:Uncharacterized protein n=1 Tax=Glomerella acutata TaxID=27357 RepID=A0AAD8XI78_GLOAC|nr:uncharacterized protein BDZ83DRAFT_649682 [Colletotrichum acutatum]KAK1727336.1 hypothetical protein BDZ83DRAFT_649682 [Colletotrichum acutatum]
MRFPLLAKPPIIPKRSDYRKSQERDREITPEFEDCGAIVWAKEREPALLKWFFVACSFDVDDPRLRVYRDERRTKKFAVIGGHASHEFAIEPAPTLETVNSTPIRVSTQQAGLTGALGENMTEETRHYLAQSYCSGKVRAKQALPDGMESYA